jgi:hypothetical protein
MRASLYLIGVAFAAVAGAGVAEVGCSSSSSPAAATPPEDASSPGPEASTPPEDTGAPPAEAAGPCTPISDASAATIKTGSALWDCYEAKCGPSLTACAADCNCNNDVLKALNCVATDAGSGTTCFGMYVTGGMLDTNVVQCLVSNAACMTATAGDGGTEGGTSSEGGGAEAGPVDAGGGG